MQKQSVTKAFTDSIAPTLTAVGFRSDGAKRYRRLSDDICQCVFLHVESRMRREFMVEYCSFLTVVPHTHYPLDHGGRFPVGSRGIWYRADTEVGLARSVEAVTTNLPALVDWFRSAETIDGYIRSYLALRQSQPPALNHNGHSSFTLACAYLLSGHREEALRYIDAAHNEFDAIATRTAETRAWALPCRDRCRDLRDRVQSQTHDSLLEVWRQTTYDALKIPA